MLRRGPIHPSRKETVCIVGGGFGGLYTALSVRKKLNVQDDVYLIDKRDSFVFLPLLYELSLGTAVDTEVAPLFSSLLANKNIKFIQGEASSVDFEKKTIFIKEYSNSLGIAPETAPETIIYDQLVLSVGIQPRKDLILGAQEHCLPFYRLEDAYALRDKLKTLTASVGQGIIKVAIIGGGYSGVEVATTIAQAIGKNKGSVTIFDRNSQIMGTSTAHNRNTALKVLARNGIKTRLHTSVLEVKENELLIAESDPTAIVADSTTASGTSSSQYNMPADLIVLTSGTEQTDFIKALDVMKDSSGRILTSTSLQSKEYENVYALGDCASVEGQFNPCTAQVAMQQSYVVASNIKRLSGIEPATRGDPIHKEKMTTFQFLNLGEMLTLGLTDASVTSLGGWVRLSGPLASIGRRLVYIVRQPTKTQTVKAMYTASIATTKKVIGSFFTR